MFWVFLSLQKNEINVFWGFLSTYINDSSSKFCVRDSGRTNKIIFKVSVWSDAQHCSSWTRNFWTISFPPLVRNIEKGCKNGIFPLCPLFAIFVENANIFSRNYHNRWLEVGWWANLICFMCLGRTFQLSRNIRQYRSFLQTDVKWLFLSILGLPEVWHVILRKTALFNIYNFSTNGKILVNIRCCLSWEHILPFPFVAIGPRFSNVHNFYYRLFLKSNTMFPVH